MTRSSAVGKKKQATLAELSVVCGKVTFGESSISIPIRLERGDIGIEAADQMFVGRRLKCMLCIGADPQQKLFEDGTEGPVDIQATAESKKLSVGRKHFGATLNFMLEDLNDAEAAHFANKSGTFTVFGVEDLPEAKRGRPAKSAGDDDDDGDEDDE